MIPTLVIAGAVSTALSAACAVGIDVAHNRSKPDAIGPLSMLVLLFGGIALCCVLVALLLMVI